MRLFVWFGIFELGFVGMGLLVGPAVGRERRSHFCARVLLVLLSLLAALLLVVIQRALSESLAIRLWLMLMLTATLLSPVLCYQSAHGSPGQSDEGGGGGSRPDPPAPPPSQPRGELPLADADQAHARVRDHNRPVLRDGGQRRHTRERPRVR